MKRKDAQINLKHNSKKRKKREHKCLKIVKLHRRHVTFKLLTCLVIKR